MSSSNSDSDSSTSAPETPAKAAKSRHLASATKQVKTPKQPKKRPTMSDRKKRVAGAALKKKKATKQGKTEIIPNKKGVNKKAPNFTTEEDVFLYRAFVNISQDGARGTDRKAEHFWEQVKEAFVQLYEEEAEVKGDGQGAARDYNSLSILHNT